MEITNFLTLEFLLTFIGTILAVELIVAFTKDAVLIKRIPTKIYTLLIAMSHLFIVQVIGGQVVITTLNMYLMFINALVIAVMLCGGYDFVVGKIKINGLDKEEM